MKKENLVIASKEVTENAIDELEKMGDKLIREFLRFIENPNYLKMPLGAKKECLTIKDVRDCVKKTLEEKKEEIPNSIKEHIKGCKFCEKITEEIPQPVISQNFRAEIKDRIDELRKKRIRAKVIHLARKGNMLQSACLSLKKDSFLNLIEKDSLEINNLKHMVRKTLITDCDKDNKQELKIILKKNSILKGDFRLFITGFLQDGRSLFALKKRW